MVSSPRAMWWWSPRRTVLRMWIPPCCVRGVSIGRFLSRCRPSGIVWEFCRCRPVRCRSRANCHSRYCATDRRLEWCRSVRHLDRGRSGGRQGPPRRDPRRRSRHRLRTGRTTSRIQTSPGLTNAGREVVRRARSGKGVAVASPRQPPSRSVRSFAVCPYSWAVE